MRYLESERGDEDFDCFCWGEVLVKEGEDASVGEEAEVSVVSDEMIDLRDRGVRFKCKVAEKGCTRLPMDSRFVQDGWGIGVSGAMEEREVNIHV